MADEKKTQVANTGSTPDEGGARSVDQGQGADEGSTISDRGAPKSDGMVPEEDLRKLKSTYDRQIKEMREEFQARLSQQERLAEEAYVRQLTDAEREEYESQKHSRSLQSEWQRIEAERQRVMRERDLINLHKRTGTPLDLLDEAQSPQQALEIALEWQEKNYEKRLKEQLKAREEKAAANRVDVGGGRPATEKEGDPIAEKALASGDLRAYFKQSLKKAGVPD